MDARITGNREKTYLLLSHSADDSNKQVLALIEVSLDLLAEFVVGDLNIVLGGTVGGHEVEETIIDVNLVRKRGEGNGRLVEGSARTSWYSLRKTLGTSMLWVEGDKSSCITQEHTISWSVNTAGCTCMGACAYKLFASEDLRR